MRAYTRCTREYYSSKVLRVLAVLNAIEIARIACACITTRDFYSSSNRAVPYFIISQRHTFIDC